MGQRTNKLWKKRENLKNFCIRETFQRVEATENKGKVCSVRFQRAAM
jgi:hypothetical protein